MDKKAIHFIQTYAETYPHLHGMLEQHQRLDGEIVELQRHHLGPEQEAQLHALKKEKLAIKEKLQEALHKVQSA